MREVKELKDIKKPQNPEKVDTIVGLLARNTTNKVSLIT
jgi:hypothetical protein